MEENERGAAQQPQTQPVQHRCFGDCLKCQPGQRAYCASQFTYDTMRMVESMHVVLSDMKNVLEKLDAKIEAMQQTGDVFNPNTTVQQQQTESIAQ